MKKFGRIDYAANFAGVVGPGESIVDADIDTWQKCQDVNSRGVLLACKYEMRQMLKQESIDGVEEGRIPQRGSIINCASVNSLLSLPGSSAYTASKHASHGITKAAALEGRKNHIRVNAVSPGFLLTKMVEPIVKGGGKDGIMDVGEQMWSAFEARQGRKASFDEVGDVVVLLSLPRCSLVNGQNLFIDGGFTINEGNF